MWRIVAVIAFVALCSVYARAQLAGCNNDSDCIGSALVLDGASEYVDVPLTPSFDAVDSIGALTVEMWVNVTRRAGMVQAIAGKWGPRRDRDDEWLMLIDDRDSLHFKLSNGGSAAGDADNTDAAVVYTPWYGTWVHVAGTWDSASHVVRLYVNGVLVASATNALYPARSLRRTTAYLQIGSFNGLTNSAANYVTLQGQVDELRIWSASRSVDSIACGRYRKFTGTEPNLIAYYPCDGGADLSILCDLSQNVNDGNLRNGAGVQLSTRTVPQFVVSDVVDSLRVTLSCETDTTFTITLRDTSLCGSTVNLRAAGTTALTLTPNTVTLAPGTPQTVSVKVSFNAIGLVDGSIVVQPAGSCSPPLLIPLRIVRVTPLRLSLGSVAFDTLRGCQEVQFEDSTITFCNTTGAPLTITGITKSRAEFDTTYLGWQLPLTLAPNECQSIRVRFRSAVNGTYSDVLRIISPDTCIGSGSVALSGTVKQYFSAVDTLDFGIVYMCADTAAVGKAVSITNTAPGGLSVTQVTGSTGMYVTNAQLPLQIGVKQKRDLFILLKYNSEGVFIDSMFITATVNGCSITHVVYVRAQTIKIKFSINPQAVSFGNRFVGTTATQTASLLNTGITARGAVVFLKRGTAFRIIPPTVFFLNPGASGIVTVQFTPTDTLTYRDTLCVQDTTCFRTQYFPIDGTGIDGPFSVRPGALNFGPVANCLCAVETLTVRNPGTTTLTVRTVGIAGPGFSLNPVPSANIVVAPGQSVQHIVWFCPAALADGAYAGSVTYTTDNATTPVIVVPLAAVRVSTRFTSPNFTDYGIVEVNVSRDLIIRVQNGSPFPVCIDSVTAPPGYSVVSTTPPIPDTLGISRVLQIQLRFTPTAQIAYNGLVHIYTSCPCVEIETTAVRGSGAIIGASFPWSTIVFAQASRCDSVKRVVAIQNASHRQITIDSIYVAGPSAAAFTWSGVNFPTALPALLDSLSNDSLELTFFPGRSPLAFTNAVLVVVATNATGSQRFVVALNGARKSQFTPSEDSIDFGSVAVRSNAATQTITLKNTLPADTVVIDSIWLSPDVGVFTLNAPPLNASRVALKPGDSINVDVDFSPHAAVSYTAKVAVRVVSPCPEVDTTMQVYGGGFTPVVLINACFDSAAAALIGEQFALSVVLARFVPQTPVTMNLIVNYDVYAVRLESVNAPVCGLAAINYTNTGAIVALPNCVNVDSGQLCTFRFRALVPDSVVASVAIDSLAFFDDTTFVKPLIGQGCGTTATISGRCNVSRLILTPLAASLAQSAPNPAAAIVHIGYSTMEDGIVRLRVFDVLGREVMRPIEVYQRHGIYAIDLDVRRLPPGMYSYILESGVFRASRLLQVAR